MFSERVQELATVLVAIVLILITSLPGKNSVTVIALTDLDTTDLLIEHSCNFAKTGSLRIAATNIDLRFTSGYGIFSTDFDKGVLNSPPLYSNFTYLANSTCPSLAFGQVPNVTPGSKAKFSLVRMPAGTGVVGIDLSNETAPCSLVRTFDGYEWLLVYDTKAT